MQDGRGDVLPKKEQQGQKMNSSLRFSNALVYFVYHLLVNAVGAVMTLIDFTLSNARRFYTRQWGTPALGRELNYDKLASCKILVLHVVCTLEIVYI